MHELTNEQRTSYLRELLQRYGTLSLPLGSGLSFSLIQVFQPLLLRERADEQQQRAQGDEAEQYHAPENDADHDETEDDKNIQDVVAENGIEALSKSPRGRLVILGGPGTGKTTVLKHLLCYHAQIALEDSNAPLPIFLSLPDLARAGQDLDGYLSHIARDLGLDANDGSALSQTIQRGQAFVCLDSLDEVLPRLRAGIIRQINQLAGQSGNRWIVGSRFTDYKGGQFQQEQFQEWELQILDEPRRLRLATHLLPALQSQLAAADQPVSDLDPRDYVRALGEHQQAATWGENPLLFSLAAVVYLRRGTLAGSRSSLYREVINALLETREPDEHQRARLRAILAASALELYQLKGRTFIIDDLREVLTRLNRVQQAPWNIAEMLYRVLNSGLLDVVAYETYSFRHQTFQEYLVASALAQSFMSADEHMSEVAQQLAWSKHAYSRWNDIERLLVGILVQEYGVEGAMQASTWLERLLARQESAEGDPGHLSLELAIKLLGEVTDLSEWRAAETLAIETRAAEMWLKVAIVPSTIRRERYGYAYNQRMWALAPDIGHLPPVAQVKVIDPLIQTLTQGHADLSVLLGRTRSRVAAERLLIAWQAAPERWIYSGAFTESLQAYAPMDVALSPLRGEKNYAFLQEATGFLKKLGRYAPVSSLITLLHDPRDTTRKTAADILVEVAEVAEIPVEALLPLCRSNQPGAFEAARVLAHLRHPAGLELLQERLVDADYHTHQSILRALVCLDTHVSLENIVLCLQVLSAQVHSQALNILAETGQQIPIELLHEPLHHYNGHVRCAAIKALSYADSLATLPILLVALQDPSPDVVAATIQAFMSLVEREPVAYFLPFLNEADEIATGMPSSLSDTALVANAELSEALVTFCSSEAGLETRRKGWSLQKSKDHKKSLRDAFQIVNYLAQLLPPSMILASFYQAAQEFRTRTARPVAELDTPLAFLSWLEESSQHAWQLRKVAIHILALSGAEKHLAPLLMALGDEEPLVHETARYVLRQVVGVLPLEPLVYMLKHPLPDGRRCALNILAIHKARPPQEALLAALRDSHAQVRAAAANVFASWKEQTPLEALVEATGDVDVAVRVAAARALGASGQSNPALAQDGILFVLSQRVVGDPDQIGFLGQALQTISPLAPSEPLLQAMSELHRKKENLLACIVAEALAAQGTRMPVAELHQMMNQGNRSMRWLALTALGGAGSAAPVSDIIRLLDEDEDSRYYAIQALNTLWRYVPGEVFLRILREEQGKESGSMQAIHTLLHKGEQIPIDILVEAFPDADFGERLAFVEYLATLDELPSEFTNEIIAGLALAVQGSPADYRHFKKEPFKALIPRFSLSALQAMLQHPQTQVRRGVLLLLQYHPEEIPQEVLLTLLSDSSSEVRQVVLTRLKVHSQPLPIQLLLPLLYRSDIQSYVIFVLGTAGANAPLEDILPLFESPNAVIRRAVLRALRQPGLLERTPVAFFLNATGDANSDVRDEALKALKEKDPATAIACCLDALSESISLYGVSGPLAFEILQEIHPAAIPEIVQEASSLLQGGTPGRFFRSLALSSLAEASGEMGRATPELLARLGELLDWPHWEVRMKAAQALGKLRRNIPDATIRRLLELRHDPRSRAVREAVDGALAEILSLETGIEDD